MHGRRALPELQHLDPGLYSFHDQRKEIGSDRTRALPDTTATMVYFWFLLPSRVSACLILRFGVIRSVPKP
jgi:hypothetical protein